MRAWPVRPLVRAAFLSRRAALRLAVALGLALHAASGVAQAAGTRVVPAVVVWDFEDQTAGSAQRAGQGDFLRRSLSENLVSTLLQVPGLQVVERLRLKELLGEQKIASSSLADEDSRVKLGRIVGAQRMVFGGFFILGDEVQVNVRLVDTATTRVLFSDELTAPLASVMREAGSLDRKLAQVLSGSRIGDAPGKAFDVDLWRRYDQALALADADRLDDAVNALQQLLSRARDFTPAERQLDNLLARMARR